MKIQDRLSLQPCLALGISSRRIIVAHTHLPRGTFHTDMAYNLLVCAAQSGITDSRVSARAGLPSRACHTDILNNLLVDPTVLHTTCSDALCLQTLPDMVKQIGHEQAMAASDAYVPEVNVCKRNCALTCHMQLISLKQP